MHLVSIRASKVFYRFLLLQKAFQRIFMYWSEKLFDKRVDVHQPLVVIGIWLEG